MKNSICYIMVFAALYFTGCQKSFLDKKPNQALTVPTTLSDFQSLLDDNGDLNQAPYLDIVSTDDIYTTDAGLSAAGTVINNSYLWAKDLYQGQPGTDWSKCYQQVFYANVIMDGLDKFKPDASNQNQFNVVKGSALFIRALALYHIAQEYAAPFVPATATQTFGIPVRTSSDVNVKSTRGTLQQSYDQMVADLLAAKDLLATQADYKTRPTKQAALALLARVYQTMQLYELAGQTAGACLQIKNTLIDYNTLTSTLARPLPKALPNGNDEVLYYTSAVTVAFLTTGTLTSVDSTLYRSFAANDLRKANFFSVKANGIIQFKGNYSGTTGVFAGLATDEVYLIRAETYARAGNVTLAMADLNTLLQSRWKKGTYNTLTATDAEDALKQVLAERRKELVFRNTRWTDLKRLNQDSRFAVTVYHKASGQTYALPPGDPRYAFPIPAEEIQNSGIAQNPR